MTTLAQIMADDIDRIAVDSPATLTWGEQSAAGTASPVTRRDDVASEGVHAEASVEFLCRLDKFTDSPPPQPRDKIALVTKMHGHGDAVNYFIVDRETDLAGVRFTLRRT